MNITDYEIEKYCLDHSGPISNVLHDLERTTYLQTLAPQMLSGPIQGMLLRLLCQLYKPKKILEIGTFTGYATLCMALGTDDDAHIKTLEVNPELRYISDAAFQKSGLQHKIESITTDAIKYVTNYPGQYDLVFIDAGKIHYSTYYDLIFDQVNTHGLIIVDNTLWSGKILETKTDRVTKSLRAFNAKAHADPRVESLILPFRDGLSILRKL